MSEAQSGRPSAPRGRGSARGGRGGYSSRVGRGGLRQAKSDNQENIPPPSFEDEGEIGELKKKHGSKITTVKELFPDWTDEDIVFALESTDGDLEATIERITEGSVSQWGEVKKKTDRSRSKVKDSSSAPNDSSAPSGRGGRGRGGFEGRGRGRGDRGDRGRGSRGGRGASQANGARVTDRQASTDTWELVSPPSTSGAWDAATSSAEAGVLSDSTSTPAASGWDEPTNGDAAAEGWTSSVATKEDPVQAPKEASKEEMKSSLIPQGTKKTWASMFAKPPPAPIVKPASPVPEKPVEPVIQEIPIEPELALPVESEPFEDPAVQTPEAPPSDPVVSITPSKDELTETNVEQLPDASEGPPATNTVASTVASTQDPHSNLNSTIPISRPAMASGYATSALKATGVSQRSSSFQRRIMEQQEAVVMPGTGHAVDRAAVQFGSMGLNGSAEDLDVDDEREEAETRAQPPQHSPNAPRAALPPAPQQVQQPQAQEEPALPQAMRPAPGLPPVPQPSSPPQQSTQSGLQYNQFARYGEAAQKAYDPFTQQAPQAQQQTLMQQAPQAQQQTQHQEGYQGQPQAQPQQPASTVPSDYSALYTSDQQRNAYQNYYGMYGQQSQESSAAQPRTGSAFGTSGPEVQSQYATSQPQARYGQVEAQNSGQNTPNPTIPSHQSQHSQHMPQGQQGYPYNPYYNQAYYSAYMNQAQANQGHSYGRNRPMFDDARRYDEHYLQHNNQYAYGQNQGYGAPYAKQQGMYAQPQHGGYGSYDHSSSPANTGGFNQQGMPIREGSYGRTGSAQPSEAQQSAGNTTFGSMPDMFNRSSSGFGQQPVTQQHSGQQGGNDDAAKVYDAPKTGGPSPSLGQVGNRPGSANNVPGQPQGQSGLPPPQSQQNHQQVFGGYPSQFGHQYGGALSGLGVGGHQQATAGQNQQHQQSSGYGNYGAGGIGNYYGNSGRGQWGGGNYGQH